MKQSLKSRHKKKVKDYGTSSLFHFMRPSSFSPSVVNLIQLRLSVSSPAQVWLHEDEKVDQETVHEHPPLVLLGQQQLRHEGTVRDEL